MTSYWYAETVFFVSPLLREIINLLMPNSTSRFDWQLLKAVYNNWHILHITITKMVYNILGILAYNTRYFRYLQQHTVIYTELKWIWFLKLFSKIVKPTSRATHRHQEAKNCRMWLLIARIVLDIIHRLPIQLRHIFCDTRFHNDQFDDVTFFLLSKFLQIVKL